MKILVVGGSGGLGLAIVKMCLERVSCSSLVATYRRVEPDFQHPRLVWVRLDANDDKQVSELSERYSQLDWVINAAGLLHREGDWPEKRISQFEAGFFEENIKSNTLPTLLLAKHFQSSLKASPSARFVALSARVGSISDNRLGGWYSYRVSKAALNMALRTIALEWRRTLPKAIVLGYHPGTCDTDLSRPFQKNVPKDQLMLAEDSAIFLVKIMVSVTEEDSGKILDFKGQEVPA